MEEKEGSVLLYMILKITVLINLSKMEKIHRVERAMYDYPRK